MKTSRRHEVEGHDAVNTISDSDSDSASVAAFRILERRPVGCLDLILGRMSCCCIGSVGFCNGGGFTVFDR